MPERTENNQTPDDLIAIGHVTGAHGVRGWVRIRPYSEDAETLLTVDGWWLDRPAFHNVKVLRARWHGDEVLARLSTIASREEADAAKGSQVLVSRRLFPALDEGEFYWVDLIGLTVINVRGDVLGRVHGLMDNGAHQILRVRAEKTGDSGQFQEILIPFVGKFVGEIDRNAKRITVDWESDYQV